MQVWALAIGVGELAADIDHFVGNYSMPARASLLRRKIPLKEPRTLINQQHCERGSDCIDSAVNQRRTPSWN